MITFVVKKKKKKKENWSLFFISLEILEFHNWSHRKVYIYYNNNIHYFFFHFMKINCHKFSFMYNFLESWQDRSTNKKCIKKSWRYCTWFTIIICWWDEKWPGRWRDLHDWQNLLQNQNGIPSSKIRQLKTCL